MTNTMHRAHMRMTPSRTVQAARMLITDIQLWTQHARARDPRGRKCSPSAYNASQWSLNGAIAVVSNPMGVTPPYFLRRFDRFVVEHRLVNIVFPEPGDEWADACFEIWESCDDFNDMRSHAEVLNLMDNVAYALQKAGQ